MSNTPEDQGGPGTAGDLPGPISDELDGLRGRRDEQLARARVVEPVTIRGTVHLLEVEGGVWVLDTVDGRRFELVGLADTTLLGRPVTVTGRLRPDLMTMGQIGPALLVEAVEPGAG